MFIRYAVDINEVFDEFNNKPSKVYSIDTDYYDLQLILITINGCILYEFSYSHDDLHGVRTSKYIITEDYYEMAYNDITIIREYDSYIIKTDELYIEINNGKIITIDYGIRHQLNPHGCSWLDDELKKLISIVYDGDLSLVNYKGRVYRYKNGDLIQLHTIKRYNIKTI